MRVILGDRFIKGTKQTLPQATRLYMTSSRKRIVSGTVLNNTGLGYCKGEDEENW